MLKRKYRCWYGRTNYTHCSLDRYNPFSSLMISFDPQESESKLHRRNNCCQYSFLHDVLMVLSQMSQQSSTIFISLRIKVTFSLQLLEKTSLKQKESQNLVGFMSLFCLSEVLNSENRQIVCCKVSAVKMLPFQT